MFPAIFKTPYQEEMTYTRNVRNRRRVNEGSLGVEIWCYLDFQNIFSQLNEWRIEKATTALQILQLDSSSEPRISFNDIETQFDY